MAESARAKYHIIRAKLADSIRSGRLKPGSRLPAERTLAKQFSVSPMTARRALHELVEAGLLERRSRDGTYVHPNGSKALAQTTLNLIYLGFGQSRAGEIIRHANLAARERGWAFHVIRLDGLSEQIGARSISHGNLSIVLADEDGLRGCIGDAMEQAGGRSVVLGNRLDHRGVPSVLADDAEGIRLAIEHLLAKGHHRVALVSDNPEHTVDRAQIDAWRSCFVGRATREELDRRLIVVNTPRFECPFRYTHRAVTRYLTSGDADVTAMVCLTDELAVATMAASRDAGRPVPHAMSVVNSGNTALAAMAEPALTSIDVDIPAHITAAFEVLEAALADELPKERRLWRIRPRLVQRASVAEPSGCVAGALDPEHARPGPARTRRRVRQ